MMRFAVARLMIVSLVLASPFLGCGKGEPKGPDTAPLQGKVVFTKGGDVKTLAARQARIEFESKDQPGMRAVGSIAEDGSFTAATVVETGGSQGAVPGTHRGRLLLDERDEKLVARQFLSYEKSGITVKVPVEGELLIKIWR
jgi:hypothetical protein